MFALQYRFRSAMLKHLMTRLPSEMFLFHHDLYVRLALDRVRRQTEVIFAWHTNRYSYGYSIIFLQILPSAAPRGRLVSCLYPNYLD